MLRARRNSVASRAAPRDKPRKHDTLLEAIARFGGQLLVVKSPEFWHSLRQSASSEFRFGWSMADSNRRLACLPGKRNCALFQRVEIEICSQEYLPYRRVSLQLWS
jgi:hypothetical protein